MVITRFVLLAAVLLAASSVGAATTIDLGPSDYRNWGTGANTHTGAGIRSSTGQTVRLPPLNGNLSVNRNAVIPYGSISNGLRQFTRINPASVAASAAVTGLFLAVDWAWDELTQEWVKYELECPVGAVCFVDGVELVSSSQCGRNASAISDFGQVKTVTASSSFSMGGVNYPAGTTVSLSVAYSSDFAPPWQSIAPCSDRYPSGRWPVDSTGNFPRLIGMPVTEVSDPVQVPGPVDFSELTAHLPSADPNEVGQAGNDAMKRQGAPLPGFQDQTMTGPSSIAGPETTTTTTTATGDNIVTSTQTTTNITYGDTTITTTNTTVTNTYTNGNHTSTETITETPGELPVTEPSSGGTAGEWPGFCDWATVVCDFIDWFQEPFDAPEVEWPLIEDQDYEEEFDFTLASSCPEPYTIELSLFPPVQFNWQPFCDLASFIKPLVLASAAIFAAFISLGIARART